MRNLDIKTGLKKTTKTFLSSIERKNKQEAESNFRLIQKKLDKAVKQKILMNNTASRRKSRFSKLLLSLNTAAS